MLVKTVQHLADSGNGTVTRDHDTLDWLTQDGTFKLTKIRLR